MADQKKVSQAVAQAAVGFLYHEVRAGRLAFAYNETTGLAEVIKGSSAKNFIREQATLLSGALTSFSGNVHQADLDAEERAAKEKTERAKQEKAAEAAQKKTAQKAKK